MFSVSDQSPVFLKNEVCLSTVCSSFPHAEGTVERSTGQLQSSAGSVRVEPACTRTQVMLDSVLTVWTVARQAPLSMGFSRQEYWSGLPFPPPSWSLGCLQNSAEGRWLSFLAGLLRVLKENVVDLLHSACKVLGAEQVDFIA